MKYALLSLLLFALTINAEPQPQIGAQPDTAVTKPAQKEVLPKEGASKDAAATAGAPAKAVDASQRAVVLKVDKRRDRISISDDSLHQWSRKDQVCVFRVTRAVACGRVIAIGIKGAVVQLQGHAAAVKPGDEARYYEPERKTPEISDDDLVANGLLEAKPYDYNIALGYSLSLDLMNPIAHFYWAVSPKIAIGLSPAYIKKTGDTAGNQLSGYGGLLTANYFGDEYFRGLWVQFATGFYHMEGIHGALVENSNYPIVQTLFGWREDWAHGLNIGAALGGRWISPLTAASSMTEIKYNSLNVVGVVEIGFSF